MCLGDFCYGYSKLHSVFTVVLKIVFCNMVKISTVRGIGVAENGINRRWRKERGRKPSKGGFGLRVRI